MSAMESVLIVVMGVSGTGKSTLGTALAASLHMPYIDGDDLHPRSNVNKMAAGRPLTDADREPWLHAIRNTAERLVADQSVSGPARGDVAKGTETGSPTPHASGVVVACSALRRAYRDILRGFDVGAGGADPDAQGARTVLPTYFVFIDGSREVLLERMLKRNGHFMKATMLDSQLTTLEDPRSEEGVVVLSVQDTTQTQVEKAVGALKAFRQGYKDDHVDD
ncbi:P-loop containing nucleoside triphosphate hydrolase protein [Mycena pura]|uniref:gluconokinase n=1 Tax=Mycena pura TaxID=153505 RepID=A0AAD6VQT6_9AGAR|nr:P-loop containing nucleoside triphosphate hydrolase protein [Mycena pura]